VQGRDVWNPRLIAGGEVALTSELRVAGRLHRVSLAEKMNIIKGWGDGSNIKR
jgi:hypothetical protein